MNKECRTPELDREAFDCPHCGVFAEQRWCLLRSREFNGSEYNIDGQYIGPKFMGINYFDGFSASRCEHCKELVLWNGQKIIYPRSITVESPNSDMPEVAKGLYIESAQILQDSPRASAALLRLALQEILNEVIEGGDKKSINENIGTLSKQVDKNTQKALDFIRIKGNEAVHPGEIRIEEESTEYMYNILNIIVQRLISDKKQIDDLFEGLPKSIKDKYQEKG